MIRLPFGPQPIGETLGRYQILGLLGSGGAGDVYRARDLSLMREVALKFLRDDIREATPCSAWFHTEARLASALNHPNVVTIHEFGGTDSMPYIAMELIRGATLRELLSAGRPSIEHLLRIGLQIASGLAKAHEAGIIHRDLKLENVMLSDDGIVKILDFGGAKSFTGHYGEVGEHGSPPVAGTVAYMSPEQVRGRPLDFRSDQFSFGIVLYELAAGSRPFDRPTALHTFAAIAEAAHMPLLAANPHVPAALSALVDRCLSKDPNARYASTRDLALQLKAIAGDLPAASATAAGPVIEVMPFLNMSADAASASFCEGLAEEVRIRLGREPSVTVSSGFAATVAPGSLSRFPVKMPAGILVEGSVRRFGDRVRIGARLTDAHKGHSLWSAQYDRSLHHPFRVQTAVANRLAAALMPVLKTWTASNETAEGAAPCGWNRSLDNDAISSSLFAHCTECRLPGRTHPACAETVPAEAVH